MLFAVGYATFGSLAAALGFFAHTVFDSELGINLAWEVWAAIALVLVAVMGRRQIDLNAAVLGVALVVEVLIVLSIDVAIVADKGLGAFSFDSAEPAARSTTRWAAKSAEAPASA